MNNAELIALDWGTTNLRASVLGTNGQTLETRNAACGILSVPGGAFARALEQLCGDWLAHSSAPVLASG